MNFFKKKTENQRNFNSYSEVLFSECYDKVYRIIFSIILNKEQTEDIVQEAFYKALNHINALKKDEKFSSWVISIALNEMKDQMKKRAKQQKLIENVAYNEIASDLEEKSPFDRVNDKMEIQEKLSMLSEKDREILILNYILDYPIDKIAEHFEINPNNARVRLNRAKARLKTLFIRGLESEGGMLNDKY